jgi:hypothetical protein
MIWWFLILGVSTLVVVCVAIAIYLHLRRNLQKSHTAQESNLADGPPEQEHPKR